ncbi:unnamed protein product [marine sediment metagenome]|uniref:Uncharacterized protein n=1 Tax=marine sediment metagenome TaxID=412755 RepID=X1DPB2_9ZZZZ
MKVQTYVSSEDGILFDVSFCTDETIFKIIELTKEDVDGLFSDVKTQVSLLKEAYKKISKTDGL